MQIDEQDAEERAELRRRQIDSANKMLYDDTDRPKALHSKMLLSDVMHERVAQMDYAQQIKALKRQQDDLFLLQQAARLKVTLDSCLTCRVVWKWLHTQCMQALVNRQLLDRYSSKARTCHSSNLRQSSICRPPWCPSQSLTCSELLLSLLPWRQILLPWTLNLT